MQYKMLNELLEVALALQPQKWGDGYSHISDALKDLLDEGNNAGELTAKQKRVLNCLTTICNSEQARKGKAPSKTIGFINGYSSNL